MATTQSADPNEKVDHPRHYNQHSSGIETIELIEHLTGNLHSAVKYIWRCGLKKSETPLRDMKSAKWYTERERARVDLYELSNEPSKKTDIVWRALARQVIIADGADTTLASYLDALLSMNFERMLEVLEGAIAELENAEDGGPP